MTAEKEGYIGFEVQFVDGKVSGWRTFLGNPSYAPISTPPEVRWYGRFWVVFIIGAFVYGLIRAFNNLFSENQAILKAYKTRDIPTRHLPVEFRFITNDTTLQEVIDKAGPYTRERKFPIDPNVASGGYAYTEDPPGMPAIVLIEYDLPYQAAVILLPEYPFQPGNRIRAVFYRRPRPDEEV